MLQFYIYGLNVDGLSHCFWNIDGRKKAEDSGTLELTPLTIRPFYSNRLSFIFFPFWMKKASLLHYAEYAVLLVSEDFSCPEFSLNLYSTTRPMLARIFDVTYYHKLGSSSYKCELGYGVFRSRSSQAVRLAELGFDSNAFDSPRAQFVT